MNYVKFVKWAYLVLAIITMIALGVTFFVECKPITQVSLLILSVGYSFISGALFLM